MKQYRFLLISIAFLLAFSSCREDVIIPEELIDNVTDGEAGEIIGFYLLNEGNMGMNKASIDYFDYTTGNYHQDIYPSRNPSIVKELGDVGNDIQIYGNKLYAVINCSNYIEVMDKRTAVHIGSVAIPNCRYLAFYKGKAYISSYSGKVEINPNAEKGFVAEIDTATLSITRKVTVGYQPEEMVIHNGKLYVANSGGYRVPNYDRTVSVIDLNTFEVKKTIDVAINLHRMKIDKRGDIYVSSRGDHNNIPPNLFVIDTQIDEVKQNLNIQVNNMYMCGDSLYYYGIASAMPGQSGAKFGILDTRTKTIINDNIITDGTDKKIVMPYGLTVNPNTKEIYITDAQNYVVSGYLYCFRPDGTMKWRTLAGNIPAHITFLRDN